MSACVLLFGFSKILLNNEENNPLRFRIGEEESESYIGSVEYFAVEQHIYSPLSSSKARLLVIKSIGTTSTQNQSELVSTGELVMLRVTVQ
jgi:hypothetical protein